MAPIETNIGDVTEPVEVPTTPPTHAPLPKQVWAIIAALGVVILVAGYFAVKMGSPSPIDDGPGGGVIEALVPTESAEVLRQTQVGIDLTAGYTGTLSINGTEIPENQLSRVPELNQIFYRPAPGKVIDQLDAGRNCVTASFWLSSQGPDEATVRTWCFEAT